MVYDYDNEEKNNLENMDPEAKARALQSLMQSRDPLTTKEELTPVVDPLDFIPSPAMAAKAAGKFGALGGVMGINALKGAAPVAERAIAKEAANEAAQFIAKRPALPGKVNNAIREAEVLSTENIGGKIQQVKDFLRKREGMHNDELNQYTDDLYKRGRAVLDKLERMQSGRYPGGDKGQR